MSELERIIFPTPRPKTMMKHPIAADLTKEEEEANLKLDPSQSLGVDPEPESSESSSNRLIDQFVECESLRICAALGITSPSTTHKVSKSERKLIEEVRTKIKDVLELSVREKADFLMQKAAFLRCITREVWERLQQMWDERLARSLIVA